ncbi:MAG: sigma-54-dependent transcriptional regulator [Nitrospinota bacterium]
MLVIDDDPEMEWLFKRLLEPDQFVVTWVGSAEEGLKLIEQNKFEIAFLDLYLPGADGLEVLKRLRSMDQDLPVIIITGHGDITTAVEAIRIGAYDFLTKPFDNNHLLLALNRALEKRCLEREIQFLRAQMGRKNSLKAEMGESRVVEKISQAAEAVASTDYTVIIQGETGTGKELVARYIHNRSPRRKKAFIGVDCGAVAEGVLESQLFGHERGAFTGADAKTEGILSVANGGTILLDEVTNLTPNMQRKFLRVLEEKEFLPVGGKRAVKMDVRILAACNGDLEDQVKRGDFRKDLYHRLNEFSIVVPPLRERKEDIPFLADKFRRETNRELGKKVRGFSEGALDLLLKLDYPGNVRELKNVVRRAMLWADDVIEEKHLSFINIPSMDCGNMDIGARVKEGLSLKEIINRVVIEAESSAIEQALALTEYNRTKAAKTLQIDRKTLYRKMKGIRC